MHLVLENVLSDSSLEWVIWMLTNRPSVQVMHMSKSIFTLHSYL